MSIPPELRFFSKSWLLLILLFSLDCQWHWKPEKEIIMTDISLIYHWDTGSIPPPDYYEFEIIVRPTHDGEIYFRPGYPAADTPCWLERFKISHGDYGNLLHSVQELSFQEKIEDSHVGGSRETLHLQSAERKPVEQELASNQGRKIAQMIKNIVPQDIWQRLFNMFESYRDEHR